MVQADPTPIKNADKPLRDARGYFAKGNKGGPGNPYIKRIAQLRALIYETLDDAAFKGLIYAMQRAADNGDVAAAKLLLEYSIGRPRDVEPESDDQPEAPELPKYQPIVKRIAAVDAALKTSVSSEQQGNPSPDAK